jgi:hypothetical protein
MGVDFKNFFSYCFENFTLCPNLILKTKGIQKALRKLK